MTDPIPPYAQRAYAILRARFDSESFGYDYFNWFVSRTMAKKILRTLEKAGWIKRIDDGKYQCIDSAEIFEKMVELKVPELLRNAQIDYLYVGASAAEIWTDYTYVQRGWEHSAYYIQVRESDVEKWIKYLREHRIKVFIKTAKPSFGEFVILEPSKELKYEIHNGLPVESLSKTVKYCEEHIASFEYHLAYLVQKYKVKTKAGIDERISEHAQEAIA